MPWAARADTLAYTSNYLNTACIAYCFVSYLHQYIRICWLGTVTQRKDVSKPVIVMEYGCHSTLAPMRPMTSAKRTSPCKLLDPHPSTVIVLPVTVAPAWEPASSTNRTASEAL